MINFIIYSLETAISLALFYAAYWIFLKNETFFKWNRFYLMFSVAIALVLPLLNITVGESSFINRYLLVPIEQCEQSISINLDNKFITTRHGKTANENDEFADGKMTAKANVANKVKSDPATTIQANFPQKNNSKRETPWLLVALVAYFIGASLFMIRLIANFTWVFTQSRRHKPQQISGMKIIRLEKNISPFSFLSSIFISNTEYPEAELAKIISHERIHIQQKHTIDRILFELLLVFQWFNPFVWLYKRAIKTTHEYLADNGALDSGIDMPSYQYSLLNQVLKENNVEIASSYNFSIQKRIAMMEQKRSSKLAALKLIILFPLLIFLFSAFAFSTPASEKDTTDRKVTKKLVYTDTSIKRVDVPIAYLKQLEGEYVATNEPGRNRKIIFTEALGSLHGLDDGYSYKIIPVGDGKFINPDDHASLLFDTKDKNAISLLLFGKIHLSKVKTEKSGATNRSMAYTMINLMLKDGIPSALSYYKSAKDSNNVRLSENDMNLAGYELLQAGKAKEAAAIFKLNTQLFSTSFNTFDSYGEALLALGDKTGAIENYKESVRLNPGSKSGLKALKELGVNTDEVIKKHTVALEELTILEGDYLSTNQPNWMRWIRFAVEAGVLIGNDNGYRYSLIPMGDGKFINPDDGVSLIFNTKNKEAISLLIFGNTTLNKVKKSAAPTFTDLKKYSGVYLPAAKDTALRSMEIINSETKLFRFIKDAEGSNRTIELEFVTENVFFYTDKSRRSVEFILDNKKEVTGCVLRRFDGAFTLSKKK